MRVQVDLSVRLNMRPASLANVLPGRFMFYELWMRDGTGSLRYEPNYGAAKLCMNISGQHMAVRPYRMARLHLAHDRARMAVEFTSATTRFFCGMDSRCVIMPWGSIKRARVCARLTMYSSRCNFGL